MVVLFKLYGLYDRDVKRISHSTVDDLPWLFHATVIGGLVLWLYARYTPMGRLDFLELAAFGFGVIVFVLGLRCGRAQRRRGADRLRAVPSWSEAVRWPAPSSRKLAHHPEYRVKVVGALVPEQGQRDWREQWSTGAGHAERDRCGRRPS